MPGFAKAMCYDPIKVKIEGYLHRILPLISILAALGPGVSAWKMIRLPAVAKTITEYGPLPEVNAPALDSITLAIAILLFIAALFEATRLRVAAPIILATTVSLWIYYVPGIWDEMTGTTWFAMKLGRTTAMTWQMLTYQIVATLTAGGLTYLRFIRRVQVTQSTRRSK